MRMTYQKAKEILKINLKRDDGEQKKVYIWLNKKKFEKIKHKKNKLFWRKSHESYQMYDSVIKSPVEINASQKMVRFGLVSWHINHR